MSHSDWWAWRGANLVGVKLKNRALTSPFLPIDSDLELTILVEGCAHFQRPRGAFGQRRTQRGYLLLLGLVGRFCWEQKREVFAPVAKIQQWLCYGTLFSMVTDLIMTLDDHSSEQYKKKPHLFIHGCSVTAGVGSSHMQKKELILT